jgi:hypothetical protein
MHSHAPVLLGAALIASLILMGVVMAENHEPVGIAPDAPRKDGAQVATFGLG